ncbi:MAG: HAD-IA family hydrolase [Gammaproteobacteria bacterium]|nr:HAD-IA family hydrolase [Gammaproteobacteria bacterium]
MGVIFNSADDVAELLIPFVADKSGGVDEQVIQSAYLAASLGNISPDEFWNQVNVAAELEDSYLSRHSLNAGILELLSEARASDISVWCLSNDVGRWSDKLRNNLGIEEYLAGSIISGDVGVRKPDKEIYEIMIQSCGYRIEDILFVDDREKNVSAARALGVDSVLFRPEQGFTDVKNWISQRAP